MSKKVGRITAWDKGMLAARQFKKMGGRINESPMIFFGELRHIPREQRRIIARNVRKAKAGKFYSTKKLNEQFCLGFFTELGE